MTIPHLLTRRRLVVSAAALALSIPAAGSLAAQSRAGGDAWAARKIIVSDRLGMLGQRISRAAFFAALDVDGRQHLKMMAAAAAAFEQDLTGLRTGDDAQGLPAEGAEEVLAQLDRASGIWAILQPTVAGILESGELSTRDIETIATTNVELLGATSALVKSLFTAYGTSDIDMGLAISIDVAGRQQMLSQKMAKEAAMIALGLSPAETQTALARSIQQFEGSLTALIEGLPTITLPPPPEHIKAKLIEVQRLWQGFGQAVTFVAETGIASPIELRSIATQADPLLDKMNDAASMYELI